MILPGRRLEQPRCQILVEYAKWTAFSAVRVPKSPIKDKKTIYQLLNGVAFAEVLSSGEEVSAERFDCWHQRETEALCNAANELKPDVAPFPVGWSAKLINVFLKTAAYAGGLGREGLCAVLHPPLDNGLKSGLKKQFHGRPDMLDKVDFGAIKDIREYPRYRTVIEGCCVAAKDLNCYLIEVEQLAGLGLHPGENPPGELASAICRCVR